MIPKQKHIVKKYEDDGNGACKKVTNSYIPNSWNFYLGNQVRRFIERNTHQSDQDYGSQKLMLAELRANSGDDWSIWDKISPKYTTRFKLELLAYQQELQLFNEFFEGAEMKQELLEQLDEFLDFREG